MQISTENIYYKFHIYFPYMCTFGGGAEATVKYGKFHANTTV